MPTRHRIQVHSSVKYWNDNATWMLERARYTLARHSLFIQRYWEDLGCITGGLLWGAPPSPWATFWLDLALLLDTTCGWGLYVEQGTEGQKIKISETLNLNCTYKVTCFASRRRTNTMTIKVASSVERDWASPCASRGAMQPRPCPSRPKWMELHTKQCGAQRVLTRLPACTWSR